MAVIYQICAFGQLLNFTDELRNALSDQLAEFSLEIGKEVELALPSDVATSDSTVATVGLFFGGNPKPSYDRPKALSDYDFVIPVVSSLDQCSVELPDEASRFNAMAWSNQNAPHQIASAILECLGLVPARRRIFLSYRRTESRNVALQLFDELSERQFDIFLDTHEIRSGAVFQDMLWHHLSDCDVMLMLDTVSYFQSRWTTEEFGQANLKKASILRIGYPGVVRDKNLSVTSTLDLSETDFEADGTMTNAAIDRLADGVERLRSKSVAVRQSCLVGSFRSAVEQLNGKLGEPGQMRRVQASFPNGRALNVYPIVGVPTSDIINKIVDDADGNECALLYDHVGILQSWQAHLEWLGERVDRFHWIKSDSSYQALRQVLS